MTEHEQDQIRTLLQKIETKQDEIKYRSISSLYSKLNAKLVPVTDLPEFYPDLPSYLLQFINEYQMVAQRDILQKAVQILSFFSQTDYGSQILNEYGAVEFFYHYRNNVAGDSKLEGVIDTLLANMVKPPGQNQAARTINNATIHASTINKGTQMMSTVTERFQTNFYEDKENLYKTSGQQRLDNSGGFGGTFLQSAVETKIDNDFMTRAQDDWMTASKLTVSKTTTRTQAKPKPYHVESDELIKLKNSKEDFFPVVYVPLSEADERFLFDVTVQLKHGDNKTVRKIINEQMADLIKDFPLESLFLQGEMLQELLSLIRKSPEDLQYQVTEIYVELLKKMKMTIEMYENPYHANQSEAQHSEEFLVTDEKAYIKNSYPTLKPPSAEFQKDPAFKKTQRETYSLNYFLLLDGIVDATVDLIESSYFADNVNVIWKYVIELLRKHKVRNYQLIEEVSKDYLRRLVKKIEGLNPEDFYGKIEFSYLFNVLYALMRMFSIEEYQQMQGFRAEPVLDILLKGMYRFIFTEKEVENILNYSQYLAPNKYATYEKIMSLLNSVVRLKNKELDLLKIDFRDIGRDPREVPDLVDMLEKVMMGVPFASIPKFIELYLEVCLYSQIIESNLGEQMYERCRNMVLTLLNIPNSELKTILLENMITNLQGESLFIYGRERYQKKTLMFQSLFDEELMMETIFTSLENDVTVNSLARILLSFLNQTLSNNVDRSKCSHFLTCSTLIHYLTVSEKSPSLSDSTSSSAPKYEALKPVTYAIYKVVPHALFKNLIADLFSKDQKRRVLAFRYLSDNLFIQKLLGGNNRHERMVYEFEDQEKRIREGGYSNKARERDPLEGFLDQTLSYFVHKEVAGNIGGELEGNIDDIMRSVENLMKIASDHSIEYRLRLSSLEQLGEMLDWLLKAMKRTDKGFKREILGTIERIVSLAMENLIMYCQEKNKDRDVGYIGRTLGLMNKILGSDGVPGETAWSLVGLLYDINSQFMTENAGNIVNLLISLLDQRNESVRYQALLALNYIGLGIRLPREKLSEDWKPSKGAMSLRKLEDKFFVVGEFEWVEYQSKHKDFWKFLPLEDDANYFLDMHVVNVHKLNDPSFSVQDYVLDEKCRDFCLKILQETGQGQKAGEGPKALNDVLVANAEKWAKLIPTMEIYLPSPLLEVDIFSMLTKVYSSCLTFFKMRNDSMIERITKLLDKLLKSEVLIQEVRNSDTLLQNILEFLDFMASNVLGPLYEIQSESSREKMDVVLSALCLVNRFLSFSHKSKQVKIKHILAKKIIKQNFIDLLKELSTFFNNNEILHLTIGKVCKNLLRFPEIYLVLNLKPLIGNLFDFMFQCSGLEHFKNKHLERWFLRFFLAFSLWEEESAQATVMQNLSQSLNKLPPTSKDIVSKSSWLGWLLRISEDRETQIRIYAWNLMCNLANKRTINDYQSSVETALLVLYAPNESFGVITNAVNYINKTLDLFMNEGGENTLETSMLGKDKESQELEESRQSKFENENKKTLDKQDLLRALYRKNILSRLKAMLANSSKCPPVYLCSLVALLRNICVLNPQKAMPVMSQLELWDLLVEVINPKAFKGKAPGKKLLNWGKGIVEVVMLVNNVMQLFVFGMSYDKQVGEYLVYCTQLLKVMIKWLRLTTSIQEQPFYKENAGNSFLVDGCSATLIQILNSSIVLNEDKAIVMINKLYEDKIEKESKESRYNIYLLVSKLFSATKNDMLILTLFRLISNLLPRWKKGLHLVESKDINGETLSESLILNLFSHFKLNEMVLVENKIVWDDYVEAKTTMTSCSCALLNNSNPAKLSFIYSGYLAYCLKNMVKSADTLLLEDVNVPQTNATTKRKTPKEADTTVLSLQNSQYNKQVTSQNLAIAYEDIKSCIKLLKYFFAEATIGDFRKEELNRKLEDQVPAIFDSIFRSWRFLSRKEELFQEIAKALCNFASNKQINALCFVKLTDIKSPILNDATSTINKFEAADKSLLKISFELVRNIAHSKEARSFLYKTKVLENCVMKLNKLWNGRREWNINNPIITNIIELFLAVSFFKDSHDRVLSDSSLLEQLFDLSDQAQLKGKLVEKIWILISNLAYNKSTKHFFLKYEKIFAMGLSILNLDDKSLKLKWISTHFFVNILHKCNAAVALIKKEHIIDQFYYLKKEMERELDKLTFTNASREENEEKIFIVKNLIENLNKINLFIKQV